MKAILTCPICDNGTLDRYLTCVDQTVTKETFNLKKCTRCQFVVTTPRPDNTDLNRYYKSPNYTSHNTNANSVIDNAYMLAREYTIRWKLNILIKYNSLAEQSLLDVGCGTGQFISYCKRKGWKITGVEPTIDARQKAISLTSHEEIYESLELVDQQFSIITLWHVLEHIPDLKLTIAELGKKLKDNGTLIIALPNHKSWDAALYREDWAGYDVPRHLWHFNRDNINQLLASFGLTIIEEVPMKLDAFYVSLLSEKYKTPEQSQIKSAANAIASGIKSNQIASKTGEYSSLIYIAKK